MRRSSYGERDYAFGQAMLTLRTAVGLTQAGLADFLRVSRRAVGEWEAGSSYPKAEHLKHFIALCIEQHAFPGGQEAEEVRTLWRTARQKVLLDEQWLAGLLGAPRSSLTLVAPAPVEEQATNGHAVAAPRVDWGEAVAAPVFYGREEEQALLQQWLVQERCRVVSLLGLGGIGKSTLAVNLMEQVAAHFEGGVIFRSLRDAPSCESLLDECLQVLAPQPLSAVPNSLEQRLSLLLEHLRARRVLLVLDNLESLLEEGDVSGRMRVGYEGYGRLLKRVGESTHQSCLLLTSREKPMELRALEGSRTPVRSLRLVGLEVEACTHLLAEKGVEGSEQERARLMELYGGNPLALKIVAETIVELFGGEISQFLAEGTVIFGSMADLLGDQVERLSELEQTVLYWLAILREPVTIEDLLAVRVVPLARRQVLEAIDGLRRRSLIERGQRLASFTLQSVVLEYVTGLLVAEASGEIRLGEVERLIQYGLEQAYAKEYVRQTQERLLLGPILVRLRNVYKERSEIEERLLELLEQMRGLAEELQGYAPANLVALLRVQQGHLRSVDLSHLVLRGANLQSVEMQNASLAGALLRDCALREALNVPWAVAISRDGEYWAAGSMQGGVHIWRRGIQTLHRAWPAHTDTTIGLSFSPDGQVLATGSWDGTVKAWDVETGALLWTGWHTNSINSVAFAPDGRWLASAGSEAVVRLWDPHSGINRVTLEHPHPVYAVTWSADGRLLASGDFEGQIRVWQMRENPPVPGIELLSAHTNWVTGLAFAPDGRTLASASWDGTVRLWEVSDGTGGSLLQIFTEHTDRVNRVAWSPDGRTLASAGRDRVIWLWNVEQGSYRMALQEHTSEVYSLAFEPAVGSLLSGSEDGTLRVWDVVSGQCVHSMHGYAVSLYDVDWSPDGTQLVSGGTDTVVTVWNVADGSPAHVLRGHRWIIFGVGWSPDGQWLASSGWDNVIRLWDTATGTCVQVLRDLACPDIVFEGVAWSADGRLLAVGTDKRAVQVWDVATGSLKWVGRAGSMLVDDVAWSPDGMRLASTSGDGHVCLWDAADGTLLQRWSGHHGRVIAVAWSPDGRRLVSCGGKERRGELFVWDMQSGERVQTLSGQSEIVSAVIWSPDGDLLVSGGSDGVLRWWEAQHGECVRKQAAHRGTIQSLRVSRDGQKLASCGDDGAIMLWDLHSGEHIQTLRRDRPYEWLNITGIRGLTEAQKATLQALGAIEEDIRYE